MIFIKKSVLLFFLTALIPIVTIQESKMETLIVSYFNNGDAKNLSKYFNQHVELTVSGNKNIYSKAQAQQIVAKFFSDNKPASFIIHSNTLEKGTQNMIGLFNTEKTSFRVYIVLKKTDEKDFIHILKIENRQEQQNSL